MHGFDSAGAQDVPTHDRSPRLHLQDTGCGFVDFIANCNLDSQAGNTKP